MLKRTSKLLSLILVSALVFLSVGVVSVNASAYDKFINMANGKLGKNEQKLCDTNKRNCVAALALAKLAWDDAASKFPKEVHNLRGDAFRHGMWQGQLTLAVSKAYAQSWGDVHEKDNPGPALENTMDVYNNEIGRSIGASKWFNWTVYSGIEDGIKKGSFKIIKNGKLVWSNQ